MHTFKHRMAIAYLKAVCTYARAVADLDAARHEDLRVNGAPLWGWMAARTSLHSALYAYSSTHNLRITH